ncbi:ATP-binding protein [Patiriisocius sp. Uisw_047]|jgi:two-component sensor histidine kinase|uniref:tetratricopeptide repeat-containing sensor histidine kinase n=1 Tax=Patiriisocius sp. Uisw_047 TaxID=3230969 RepID=UPI0039E73A9F
MKHVVLFLFLFLSFSDSHCQKGPNKAVVISEIQEYYKAAIKAKKDQKISLQLIDKAAMLSKENGIDSLYFKSLYYKSILLRRHKLHQESILNLTLLIDLASAKKDTLFLAKSRYRQARDYLNIGNLIASYKAAQAALIFYKKIPDSIKASKAAERLSNIQNDLGDFIGAEKTALTAIDYAEGNQNISNRLWLYNALGRASKEQGQSKDAIKYYNRGIDETLTSIEKAVLTSNIAVVHITNENWSKVIELLSPLLNDPDVKNNASTYARILSNLAYADYKNGNQSALSAIIDAMSIRKENKDILGIFSSYVQLAKVLVIDAPREASGYANDAYKIALRLRSPEARLEALDILLKTEQPNKIKEIGLLYSSLSDSLQTAERQARTTFLKFQFESDRLEQQNQVLTTESLNKSLKFQKARTTTIISATAIIILSLLTGIWFIYRVQRLKKEKQQAHYKTEIAYSKKVHDELANDLFYIMQAIDSKEDKNDILDRMDIVYHRSRDISKATSMVDTGSSYAKNLSFTLSSYCNGDTRLILQGIGEVPWDDISEVQKIAIYRVLQELMTNMKKHSEASHVVISFKKTAKLLKINYYDNGKGIDKKILSSGSGIQNVETRIFSCGGTVNFASETTKGTSVSITLPR